MRRSKRRTWVVPLYLTTSLARASGTEWETMLCRACRLSSVRRREAIRVSTEFMLLVGIGFVAQLVDGALGMAYGVLSNTALLTIGLPPAQASALVHTAEVFTTGASAASHMYHRNVDWRLVARLGVAGVLGAVLGAWVLSNVDITAARRWVYGYLLLMGFYILWRSVHIALAPRTLPAGPRASDLLRDFSTPVAAGAGDRLRPRRSLARATRRARLWA